MDSGNWTTVDYGIPLEEEFTILNGEIFTEGDPEDPDFLYRRLDDPNTSRVYHFICSDLADEVMKNRIGYSLYSEDIFDNELVVIFENSDDPIQEPVKQPKIEKRKSIFGKLFGS